KQEQVTKSVDTGAAALWASAFVIMAMIVTQASRLGLGSAAYADVSKAGDLTTLTAAARNNDDILLVLDGRTETLSAYGIMNRSTVRAYPLHDLRDLFTQARANAR
ncbi:MAG: hypothetical protein KDA20_07300, partial [Phycisphaerales bacterium]|nr:hypothetical protein [Phycisphaerales bacterium]